MVIKNEKEGKLALERIKKGLLKQVAISAKYGFDVKKHWNDMMAYLEKEKAEEEKEEIKKKKKEEFGNKLAQAMVEGLNRHVLEEESKTDLFKKNPNLKKPKTDYGALTVKALRRMK
ncbi:MAG: hypothetical protein Q7K54_05695 [Candidatus Parcubacteria bacterium]|nr:hypothetical protein [Candidatus Parcubacteria bacterium]